MALCETLGRYKEKFVPVQVNQDLCLKCEKCLRACTAKAIYFEHGVRLVDYTKCKACLNCVQVCPRNAIQVTSIEVNDQVVSMKIDREKCNLCEECINDNGKFCPKNLFYRGKVNINENQEQDGIKFKFREISKCQGCLKCTILCPQKAIKPIKFNV
ncbi:MAG TPA: 4Fe-4S dicluster domain-containing protein [bacterium]|nr:4Fe-4S dicluster domain-containing protein [bacterium]